MEYEGPGRFTHVSCIFIFIGGILVLEMSFF